MPSLHITDTRIASCLDALGFDDGQLNVTIHTQTRHTQVEVVFSKPSTRFPLLDPHAIVGRWQRNRMSDEPMHMLAVMMRAQESYDAFLKLQREGGQMCLVPCAEVQRPLYYKYLDGCGTYARGNTVTLEDLSLAACLGPLGIGLVQLQGSRGEHRYQMAALGLPILDSAGQLTAYHTADLIPFAPSGPRRLRLEDSNPHHPLVIAYDSMQSRQHLKKQIEFAKANLLITAGDGSSKQALIALNYKGHVGDAVSRHFKAPPGSLGL